jgi:predicted DNA-binding protein
MTRERFTRVILGFPPSLLKRLDSHAQWAGVSRAEAARSAIADHLRDAEDYRRGLAERELTPATGESANVA